MSHLFNEKYSEKYSNFPFFSPLVTFISSEQPLGDSLLWGKSILKNILNNYSNVLFFSPLVTFISSQQPLGESAALTAHEHTFCKVGRNWEKWGKGNKILEVWQKIKCTKEEIRCSTFRQKEKNCKI